MKSIDPVAFGARVRERRTELGMSQEWLADASGYSQSNIGWIEKGKPRKPQRAAFQLAKALQTSPEWLLWKEGPKHIGPTYLPDQVFSAKYQSFNPEQKAIATEAIEKIDKKDKRKKA